MPILFIVLFVFLFAGAMLLIGFDEWLRKFNLHFGLHLAIIIFVILLGAQGLYKLLKILPS